MAYSTAISTVDNGYNRAQPAIGVGTLGSSRGVLTIGDSAFLRSMIPHHSGAILMCEENRLKDPELVKLCQDIITSQTQEIAQMKQLLAERSR